MLTHHTRKKLEEERQAKEQAQPQQETVVRQEQPVQEVEFAEEFTPSMEVKEDSEQNSKRKKKGE
jgi:hypothetical protein